METLSHVFSAFCGQDLGHTWAPGGWLLPCCQRCTGLYVGASIAALLHVWLKPKLTGRFLELHAAFLLIMVPFGFHWLPQGPALRAITGVLFGCAIVAFLKLPLSQFLCLHRRDKMQPAVAAPRHGGYWASLGLTILIVPLLATYGGHLAALMLSAVAAGGLLVLGMLALANAGRALAVAVPYLRSLAKPRADA